MRKSTGSLAPPSGTRLTRVSVWTQVQWMYRCTTMQVYDLAWSPTGEYIIAGSTDNCARIFTANEGTGIAPVAFLAYR